jgi:enoyl-CoA hydratase
MTDSSAVVTYDLDDHIVTLTINRPDARNAVNGQVAIEMEAAVDRFESDPDARIAIITGAGDTFCAGADLKEIAAGRGKELNTKKGGFAGLVVRDRTKPMIAAVNGTAVAGGCEILLSCDMVVVVSGAKIGVPEVKRSLVAAAGALWRLARTVGRAKAAEMVLTGDPISASEALDLGLVNAVVKRDELMPAARELARRVAVNAPLAVQASRRVLADAFDFTEDELYLASGKAFVSLVKTEDFAEGPRAFVEKRDPVWKGR